MDEIPGIFVSPFPFSLTGIDESELDLVALRLG